MLFARIKHTCKSILRCDFLRREDGVIAIEAMIITPVIFWTFLSMFSFFDAFRTYGANQKAAFTVGDAISRETVPIDDEYLTGVRQLFSYLSLSDDDTTIRVSSIYYDADEDRHYVDWSEVKGSGQSSLSSGTVSSWQDRLPIMVDNERIVVVETWAEYDPPFATGLEQREIQNFVFTRPRYAPRVCWEDCNS